MKKTEQPIGKVGTYAYQTEVYSLDFRGRLTIPTLGDYLLHAATCHAAERGYGYEDMEARNTAWVLSRCMRPWRFDSPVRNTYSDRKSVV